MRLTACLRWHGLLLPWLLLAQAPCVAHDTWLEPIASTASAAPHRIELLLGTGAQFPKMENSPGSARLDAQGCRQGQGTLPLRRGADEGRALRLSAPAAAVGAATCWVQLEPFELELKPELIEVYFKEIAAPAAVREAWSAMRSRGLPFRERYVKHARWERFARPEAAGTAPGPTLAPAPLGLDIVLDAAAGPPRRGQRLAFTVLRDGRPLPDLAIEARSALSPLGLWLRTDAQGRAELTLPLAGRWLLRGTDLRTSDARPDTWDSRFITLAFDVTP